MVPRNHIGPLVASHRIEPLADLIGGTLSMGCKVPVEGRFGWGEGSNEPANRTSLKEPHCHRRIGVGGRHGIGGSDEQKHSAQGNFRVALWSAGTLGILGTLSGLLLGRSGCNH